MLLTISKSYVICLQETMELGVYTFRRYYAHREEGSIKKSDVFPQEMTITAGYLT
jgi:hypothetical protein